MRHQLLLASSFAVGVFLSALLFPSNAVACTDPGPPPDFWITFLLNGRRPVAKTWMVTAMSMSLTSAYFSFFSAGTCPPNTIGPSCPGDFNNDGMVDQLDDDIFDAAFLVGVCDSPFDSALITIHNYESFGANPGQFCTCALAPLGPVVDIQQVTIIDTNTGLPLPGFNFVPNTTTSGGFNVASGGTNFVGFLSDVTQAIPAGLSIDLEFLVGLTAGTTIDEIQDAYLGTGAAAFGAVTGPLSIATDEGDATGAPTGNHQSIQGAASVGMMGGPVPAMGAIGLGVLSALMIGLGVRVRNRRKQG